MHYILKTVFGSVLKYFVASISDTLKIFMHAFFCIFYLLAKSRARISGSKSAVKLFFKHVLQFKNQDLLNIPNP